VLAFYNYLPMLPVEAILESIALGAGLVAIPMVIHRLEVRREDIAVLSLICAGSSAAFAFLRSVELARLYLYSPGGPGEVVIRALEPHGTAALAASIAVLALSITSLRAAPRAMLAAAGVAGLIWVLLDRWATIVNTQHISRTLLSTIPADVGSGYWVVESVGLALITVGVYMIITLAFVPIGRTGPAGGGHGE